MDKFFIPILLFFVICDRFISTAGSTFEPSDSGSLLRRLDAVGGLTISLESSDVAAAAVDFGGLTRTEPMAVVRPSNAEDVAGVVRLSYAAANAGAYFPVSARGHGHSINGQAQAPGGVVVEMSSSGRVRAAPVYSPELGGHYVDVWGGELWIDVLNWTLANGGLAPRSWTDYLYLSVGGTLSNAGISGQAFRHGPQISNVYELDVVTGKGELETCSDNQNSELFHAVLGGLGQFGIITRARIALEPAPKRTRWIRVLYSNFTTFTGDQEKLIFLHGGRRFDYVEGFVIVDEGLINNWRSSFFSPKNPVKISSIAAAGGGVLYCLEVTKDYDDSTAGSVDQEVEALLSELSYIPASDFTTDLPYVDFLDRVHKSELKLRAKGLWDVPHPWLNLFVPASRIADFDRGVFRRLLGDKASGPILIYPMNKHKWDNERSSVVIPEEEEDVFYLVAFLRTVVPGSIDPTQSLEHLSQQNQQILAFCDRAGIELKQYLPSHSTRAGWARHFGSKWTRFMSRKAEFDPKFILGSGQRIFQTSYSHQLFSSRSIIAL